MGNGQDGEEIEIEIEIEKHARGLGDAAEEENGACAGWCVGGRAC
jgi:hypothetical protein